MIKNLRFSLFAFVLLSLFSFSAFSSEQPLWIDVRSVVEHKVDNIEGDLRVSHGDIVGELSEAYPDKNTPIKIYCRSGGRAEKAKQALIGAGYTDVENAGGINDARKQRGITK